MSLSDAFVSDPEAVKTITAEILPFRDLAGADVKPVDTVKLAQLQALLTGRTFADVFPEFPMVHEVSDDGPWVFECSPSLRTALAAFTEAELVSVAHRWSQIREFEL